MEEAHPFFVKGPPTLTDKDAALPAGRGSGEQFPHPLVLGSALGLPAALALTSS